MQAFLKRSLNLRDNESRIVLILGFILFCNALATQISGIAAVSGFLNNVGVNQILIVWFIGYGLVIASASLQSLIVDRVGRVALMRWTSFGFAMIFLVLRLMFTFRVSPAINYALLYFISDQQWLFFPLVFWILSGDLTDTAQSKRLFPVIASVGQIGKIIGIGIAAAAPTVLAQIAASPVDVLNVNILVYLLAYMVSNTFLDQSKIRKTQQKPETIKETLTEGWDFIKEVPVFRYLVLGVLTATLCDTIIEFWFLTVTDSALGDGYQTFYSLYRLGVVLGVLAIQSLITARLIERLTIKNSFFILPITLVSGFILMIAGALTANSVVMIVTAVIAMVVMRLARDTINESAKKSFQTLIPEERRGRVINFIENYMIAGGTMIGSLLTGIVVLIGLVFNLSFDQFGFHYGYQFVGLIAAVVCLWSISQMRRTYDQSMFNWRLKRRQRGQSVLSKLDF